MSTDNPKVSVCLMTYNGAATVERALTTLLAQTYRDYELIISDDHSTDDTLAICKRVAAGHEQVRFIRPERNLGAELNMKFALSQARGKYYLWACQDDYWEPKFLERLVGVLEQSPSAVCAQGQVRWISADGSKIQDLRIYGRDLPERRSRLSLAMSLLTAQSREDQSVSILKNNIFMHGLWNRAAFAAGLAAHGKPFSNERQILCQLALAGEFRYVDQILMYKKHYGVRLHERYPATDATVIAKATSNRWQELIDTLFAIVRSRPIAWHVKIVAVPALFVAYSRYRLKYRKFFRKLPKTFRRLLSSFQG